MTAWPGRLAELAGKWGLDAGQEAQMAAFLEFIAAHAAAPTTVRAPDVAVDRHLADALAGLGVAAVRNATSLADLGSGAGVPGLPLAIALPSATVTLLESVGRKCRFLEEAIAVTGARNARVWCGRIEEWHGEEVDVVCARAVAPLAVLVEYAAPVLPVGGALVAWKGAPEPAEERAGDAAADVVGLRRIEVVELDSAPAAERRRLYVYRKEGTTPDRFPRRPGMARKRPLAKCNNSATNTG